MAASGSSVIPATSFEYARCIGQHGRFEETSLVANAAAAATQRLAARLRSCSHCRRDARAGGGRPDHGACSAPVAHEMVDEVVRPCPALCALFSRACQPEPCAREEKPSPLPPERRNVGMFCLRHPADRMTGAGLISGQPD